VSKVVEPDTVQADAASCRSERFGERVGIERMAIPSIEEKDQIKNSPEFDPTRFDDDYRTRLGTYYEPYV
jgi:hypothetical protein